MTHTLMIHTHTGNIRVFCRVRPPLSGEAGYQRDSCDSTGSSGSSNSDSGKGSKKVTNTALQIGYPDETNDCRKLALQVADQVCDYMNVQYMCFFQIQ